MKRRLSLLLVMTLLTTTFMACGKESEEPQATNTEPTEAVDTVEEEAKEEVVEESAPTYAITSVEADGYDYFTGSVQCIQITDDKHPALAEAIDNQFSELVTTFNKGIDDMNSEAEQLNAENKKYAEEDSDIEYNEISYSDEYSVEVVRCDSKVFSFVMYEYIYMGGAHGTTEELGFTYDANTGELLELSSFGDEQTIKEVAANFILDTINDSDQQAKDMLFPEDDITGGYETAITESFEGDAVPEYYLDSRGITFLFQQYSIAPYAAGIIAFTVPYEELEGFNEAYLPDDGFYTATLSEIGFIEKIDIDNDSELEEVYLTSGDVEDSDVVQTEYVLFLGDKSVSHTIDGYSYISGTYIHGDDGNYVLISCEGVSVTLFEVSNGIKELGSLETEGAVKEIKDGEFVLATRVYDENGVSWGEPEAHKFSKNGIE